jgi:hypothetical protein
VSSSSLQKCAKYVNESDHQPMRGTSTFGDCFASAQAPTTMGELSRLPAARHWSSGRNFDLLLVVASALP